MLRTPSAARAKSVKPSFEKLEQRNLLANTTFIPQAEIASTTSDSVRYLDLGDIDNDGDVDIVGGTGSSLSWFENLDGRGEFSGPIRLKTDQSDRITLIKVADVDADGDADIVTGERNGEVTFYVNEGRGEFLNVVLIEQLPHPVTGVELADLDGNGQPALIVTHLHGAILYMPGSDVGRFDKRIPLPVTPNSFSDVATLDIGNDGDLDILVAGNNAVAILENSPNNPNFVTVKYHSTQMNHVSSIDVADVDGDGRDDFVVSGNSSTKTVHWFRSESDTPDFSDAIVVTARHGGASGVQADDVDGDGDVDFVTVQNLTQRITLHRNMDGAGRSFESTDVAWPIPFIANVRLADLDLDGDQDFVSMDHADFQLAWYEFVSENEFTRHETGPSVLGFVSSVKTVDINGDTLPDIVISTRNDDTVAWIPNLGDQTFGERKIITTAAGESISGGHLAFAAGIDVDNDGDIDVVSSGGSVLAWYENIDGRGTFGPQIRFGIGTRKIDGWLFDDVDNDGDIDIVTYRTKELEWHENQRGRFELHEIPWDGDEREGVNSVELLDRDNDGDRDLIVAAATSLTGERNAYWIENGQDDVSRFSVRHDFPELDGAIELIVGDIDMDNRLEIVARTYIRMGFRSLEEAVLFENDNNTGEYVATSRIVLPWFSTLARSQEIGMRFFEATNDSRLDLIFNGGVAWIDIGSSTEPVTIMPPETHTTTLDVADLDNDGDDDIIARTDRGFLWYRNAANPVPGDVNFDGVTSSEDIDAVHGALRSSSTLTVFDLNCDGSVDENDARHLKSSILDITYGDANADGTFNSSDIVQIFVSGAYETDTGDATWKDGDFNGDGRVNTSDLVLAFQSGAYVAE